MSEFQVEIRLRLEADSHHDAALWASRALDAEPFKHNPAIAYLDCHIQAVGPPTTSTAQANEEKGGEG